jgi:trimeric autotransporter adhesin
MKCLSYREAFLFVKRKIYYHCNPKKSQMCKLKLLLASFLLGIPVIVFSQGEYNTLGSTNNGCNAQVYTIAGTLPESSVIFAGGAFTNAGGASAKYVAKWDQNTFSWTSMQPHGGMNGPVRSLTYMSNKLYAAGDFIISDSVDTWHVAMWTGTQWTNLAGGIRGAGLRSVCAYNGQLYAGGFIDTISGFNQGLGVLRWDGVNWLTVGGNGYGVSGANGFHVDAMQVYNGELYVGGLFQFAGDGSISANNIAKWNGTAWSSVGTGTNGEVRCFAVIGNNLYIGGDFTSVNGVPANRIARFNGSTWSALGVGFDNSVYALANYNTELYATGTIEISLDSIHHIARWDSAMQYWKKVWSGLGYPGINFAGYALFPNSGSLYVGGSFTVAGITNSIDISRFYVTSAGYQEISFKDMAIVYPNPASGKLTVDWINKESKNMDIDIYSIDGKQITHFAEKGRTGNTEMDLSAYPRGFYFLRLTSDNKTATEKLILN